MKSEVKNIYNVNQVRDFVLKNLTTRIVILIDYFEDENLILDAIFSKLDFLKGKDSNVLFVVFQYSLYLKLKSSYPIIFSEDILSSEELEKVDNIAYSIIQNWYRDEEIKDALEFQGINIGGLLDFRLSLFFPQVIKQLYIINAMFRLHKPEFIIFLHSYKKFDYPDMNFNNIMYAKYGFLTNIIELIILKYLDIDKLFCVKIKKSHNLKNSMITKITRFQLHIKKLFFLVFRIVTYLSLFKIKKRDFRKKVIVLNNDFLNLLYDSLLKSKKYSVFRIGEKGKKNILESIMTGKFNTLAFPIPMDLRLIMKQIIAKRIICKKIVKTNFGFLKPTIIDDVQFLNIVKTEFKKILFEEIRKQIIYIGNINCILNILKPSIIILHLDTIDYEKAICFVAKQKGIPTLVVQHGLATEFRGCDKIFAHKHAVWGNFHKQRYIDFGNSADSLCITGNIHYDKYLKYFEKREEKKDIICKQLCIEPQKITITVAARNGMNIFSCHRYEDSELVFFIKVIKAVKAACGDKVQILIKLHPADTQEEKYVDIIKNVFGSLDGIVIKRNVSLDETLYISDMVITPGSTSVIEALLHDKPVIVANLTKRQDLVDYARTRAVICVWSEEELQIAINKILQTDVYQKHIRNYRDNFIYEFVYKVDGKAIVRLNDLIESLIIKKKIRVYHKLFS